jgi:hypothetical protein
MTFAVRRGWSGAFDLRRLIAGLPNVGPVLLSICVLATAQVPTSGNVFFGYSYLNSSPIYSGQIFVPPQRLSMNGWNASFEGKVLPFVGVVADFGDHYGTGAPQECPVGVVGGGSGGCVGSGGLNERNILVGPRVSMSLGRIRPFAEALFGAGHINTNNDGSDTSFATAIGGGLDYKIIRPIAWRVQADYVQTRFFDATQNNLRISTGIVVRF